MSKYLFLASLLWLVTSPTLADFVTTYQTGDYIAAFREAEPLAEKGDAKAQSYLGIMYLEGKGVPNNYQAARKWFFMAAKQGFADAQFGLGALYATGKGISKDLVKAYAWLTLAATQNQVQATELREMIVKEGLLTPVQLQRAQRLAKEWQSNLAGISFDVFETVPAPTVTEQVGQGVAKLGGAVGGSLLQPLSEELLKFLFKDTLFFGKSFDRLQESRAQREAIEHGEKPLEDCLGADNEINQTVLDCMRGK